MNEEIEADLLRFIERHKRTETLNLTWYGGEPLLGFGSIRRILEGIKKIKHIKLGLHNMPTNGYLLNKEVSLFFKDNPMNSIQVTIDGTRESHNKLRILQGNQPTFDKIIENIDVFMDYNPTTPVFIRMNLNKDNMHTFGKAYNDLYNYWKGRDVRIYPAFIKEFGDNCKFDCTVTREEKLEFYKALKEQIRLNVIFKPSNNVIGLCGATLINYYVVGPRGEMYKCWNDFGIEDKVVGYLNSDKQNNDIINRYLAGPTILDDKECQECSILPICAGGCLWTRHKNIFEGANYDLLCNMRKNKLEKTIELQYEEILKEKMPDLQLK
jgi:uncharacterized protein